MMVTDETFRRVSQLHESSGRSACRVARRNTKTRSGVSQTVRRQPPQARPEKKKAGRQATRFPRLRYPGLVNRYFVILAGYLVIREALSEDVARNTLEASAVMEQLAEVVSENLLIQIAEQMERLDTNVRSLESALEETPKVFQAVRVNLAINVPLGMVNHAVRVIAAQTFIGLQSVSEQRGHWSYVFSDFAVNERLSAVINHLCSDFSATLQKSHDGDFIVWATAANDSAAMHVGVHVASLTADESFVYLNFRVKISTAQLHRGLGLHSQTDAMEHEPRGLLGDTESASDFVGANPVLAVGNHPHCDKPLIKWERGVFHNGSDLRAELLAGMLILALPHAASRNRTDFYAPARWTGDAVRPTALNDEVDAVLWIGEVNDGLLECSWLLHWCVLSAKECATETSLSQVYYCPLSNRQSKRIFPFVHHPSFGPNSPLRAAQTAHD
jgi:hypothetical protein